MTWLYEPCGVDGRYVRVSIRAIKEGLIIEDLLLDAFIRSANTSERPSVLALASEQVRAESWRDRWHIIIGTID